MSEKSQAQESPLSSGVQSLIDRLQEEGVAAGREQSERMIVDAEKRAEWLVSQAKTEAASIVEQAREEARFIENAGREALQMALRDSQLQLKNTLFNTFTAQIEMLVNNAIEDESILKDMILEIAREARPEAEAITVILGNQYQDNDPLSVFIASQSKVLLEKGIAVEVAASHQVGLKLSIDNGKAEVELSDKVVSALILEYVRPRFRSMLEGLMS